MMKRNVDVAGALIRDGEKFFICRRPPTKGNPLKWEFPGGKLEPGETVEEALIRECREELLITVHPLRKITEVLHEYPDIIVRLHVVEACIESGEITLTEHVDYRWITVDEIPGIDFCDADVEIMPEIIEFLSHKSV